MMWLDELIIKLTCFFLIGYIFVCVEILFLSLTEDIPLKKSFFNILNYFPLSYGIFLPLFNIFFSQPYYPVGSSRFKNFTFAFEIEHTSSKFFSYIFLVLIFCLSLELTTAYYHILNSLVLLYLGYFYQVFLTFLIFQLLPLYPTLMGISLFKEIRNYFIRSERVSYIPFLVYLAEWSTFVFIFMSISMNYTLFNESLKDTLAYIINLLHSGYFLPILLFLILLLGSIFYTKKREYQEYLRYIKNLLQEAFLKDHPSESNH